MKKYLLMTAVLMAGLFMMASCARKTMVPKPTSVEGTAPAAMESNSVEKAAPEAEPVEADEGEDKGAMEAAAKAAAAKYRFVNQNIHFRYDSAELSPMGRMLLREKAEWLFANPSATVIIQGHCDERGTTAYNLALGERRAKAAQEYLIDLGTDAKRLSIISYGEERPLDSASTEEAYRKNRRDQFVMFHASGPTPAPVVTSSGPIGQSAPVSTSSDPIPTGQSESVPAPPGQAITSDVFGEDGGIFHPFLMVQEEWTDNLFTTNSNEQSDWITTVAPGLWIAVPANREKLISLSTKPTASGGLQLSRIKPEATRRYQAYAMYSPEVVLYADHSNHNHFNHNAQAKFQYNFNSGLSFDLVDLFEDREDIAGDGRADTLYRYQSNLVDFITTYDPSEKLTLRFDYSNYILDYDEDINRFRDRMDHTFDFYAFYKIKPKTSLFIEYAHAIIDYDQDDVYDNEENRYYTGINWAMTAKSTGRFKVGYIEKDFDTAGIEDQDGFSFELQTQHNFTAKRAIQANAYRKFNESDASAASSFYITGIDVGLMQKFTEKLSGTLNLTFERHEYNGLDRDDDYIRVGPAGRWEPRDWIFFDLGYYWTQKDSNIQFYDYTSNTVILRMTIPL